MKRELEKAYGLPVMSLQFIPLSINHFAIEFTTLRGKAYVVPIYKKLANNTATLQYRDVTPAEKGIINNYLEKK
ncbi:MAG: hypothetical protein KME52_28515 [Desmonostoc geniculatum HA4340-LM1]|nr:hypothetical protein [Desmonostoc geniculatum HA4340-LM1]